MTQTEAEEIARWHYPEPFAFYDWSADANDLAELLSPDLRGDVYFSVRDEKGELAGFFGFKRPAADTVEIGLGLHPERTGRGLGGVVPRRGTRLCTITVRAHAIRPLRCDLQPSGDHGLRAGGLRRRPRLHALDERWRVGVRGDGAPGALARAGRSCAAARRSSAPSSPGRRARPRAPPGSPRARASVEPKCCSSARRRAGPTPSSVSKSDSRARAERRWRWKPSANRCASSRTRWSSCKPALCGSSRIGSACCGTKTSSIRFASAITATRGSSYACIAASAAESCPLPPSMTTRFGAVAKPSSYSSSVPVRSRANRRETTSAIAAKSSWPSSPRTRELAVVRLLRRSRPGRRPSSRRSPGPGCSRCRSTRSGAAGSRG